ncbi:endonuclease/exonuclease/phosphatase family protein [Phycicoccus sp. CSK15P-2]|uniref:endonuclease/exonuclease/phosphatase family protein n=1 Tax=Phycicoccus sp. CSK15P-2 TaxID=2807627 RepID=UPI00194DEF83|nr:endonuclease/exonuclease/phosphatase family protein [Phycicoccus sp. CSK15P-2]MBM6405351.1 endonuclease/exonuclease/phosphatase family protein [Phycicoccus sp. CSK15P-2]
MDQDQTVRLSRRTLGRLAGATALTGAAGAATAQAAGAAPANSSTFRVASFNILSDLKDSQFKEDFVAIMDRAELVGLQEVQGRGDIINQWASNHGFYAWTPAKTWGREVTVLAKKSMFDRIDKGTIFVCDTGGSGNPPPPRYITWAQYVHKPSGRRITHVNNHLNAHIDDNGHPYDLPRTRDAEKHLRMIKDLVLDKKSNGQVVVTGDFNVDYQDDKRVTYAKFPYTVLENRQNGLPSLRSSYSRIGVTGLPTLGRRRVDYVYAWIRPADNRFMDFDDHHYVFDSKHSDHNAVVARLWMKH